MRKNISLLFLLLSINGCTQIITTPISVAGSVVETSIDVGAAGVGAVVGH